MVAVAPYAVMIWMLVTVGLFPSFSHPRRAILFITLSGALFLPEAVREPIVLGPFHFTKFLGISYAALLGAVLFDSDTVFSGAPRWFDVPLVVWCLCPMPSVFTNAPPPDGSSQLRDALSQTWTQIVTYGFPYLLGRLYFTDREAFRDLAHSFILAGFVYAPFCLVEVRLSPQFHAWVYGYAQHDFIQTIRFDGYRPMVFMQHGLAVAMFMVSASLLAVWLRWLSPEEEKEPETVFVCAPCLLLPTTVLLKSTGALGLGFVGASALWLGRVFGTRWVLLALAFVPVGYVSVRMSSAWSGDSAVHEIAEVVNAERAASLETRFRSENILSAHAMERPAFGWGGWNRFMISDEGAGTERNVAIPDGLWIITLGNRGLVGLIALGGTILLPVILVAVRCPSPTSAVSGCAVVLALWAIDSLLNAMVLPIYFVIAGGLTSLRAGDNRTGS